ncbi:hypothetical protein SDC9_186814 [bioreactor metagenome]|uniref:Uncharacterized protein n=1 Tax=bioreactor metagenome TaxID=1076179 RepID=A0A645HL00_9ZZZZ
MGRFAEDGISVISGDDAGIAGLIKDGDIFSTVTVLPNGRKRSDYSMPIMSWLALQVAGKFNIARFTGVPLTGEGAVNDEMITDLWKMFPSSHRPNFMLMGTDTVAALANSRTATSPTGVPAPIPATWDRSGETINIIIDDAVDGKIPNPLTTTTTSATTTTTTTE